MLGMIYRRTLYRPLMRMLHKFDLHYMPLGGPDGDMAWCQWCGLRDRVIVPGKFEQYHNLIKRP